jgi:hypothetical protein
MTFFQKLALSWANTVTVLRNTMIYRCDHYSPPLDFTLSHISAANRFIHYFATLNIVLFSI